MANEQNLVHFTSNQSRDEAVKNGRTGGLRSGEVRRERRKLRDELEYILGLDAGDGETLGNSISMALVQKALTGNVEAFKAIRDTVDGKPTDKLTLVNEPDFSALDAAFAGMKLDEPDGA